MLRIILFVKFYYFQLLLLADVELVDQFVVDFHQLLLQNLYLLLVVAALVPGIVLGIYHFYSLNYIKNTTFFILTLPLENPPQEVD